MAGKRILVTGATDGIGKQTALDLLRMGEDVVVHGRSEEKAKRAADELAAAAGAGPADALWGDLSSLSQVREMAGALHDRYDRLDVLVNNAGVYREKRALSADGFEMTFAVNHLAHFLFTLLTMDLLRASVAGRVVNVASQAHSSEIDLEGVGEGRDYSAYRAYADSKLCNILFTFELAERLAKTGITANCLHPGVINTKLLRAAWSGGSPVAEGSRASVYLATSDAVKGVSGRYFVNRREVSPAPLARDAAARRGLWEMSEEMAGIRWRDVII